ncbi:hypothetical protein [Methylomonas methanica]|uniref:Lipopolysaccharide biosynthesis protein n=1 Tax=Methylomonas methanica (strain DSM 25384 / MC09) TaxID=857087 RepID=F9ZW34_METMM|nr:hypothetical protein [Methylomonas methanica]AEG02005.1 hypothetical protein Metme_3644 [Methylomonas methanica MC09]
MYTKSSNSSATDYSDEISLHDATLKLWLYYRGFARPLLPAALLSALAAAFWVSVNPLYAVTAILDTPQLSLNDWRTFSPLLTDKALVQTSLSSMKGLTQKETAELQRGFLTPKFWDSRIQYRTALRRDDLKDTPNAELKNTDTLGLEISITARDENAAAQKFEAMANHIRQTMIWYRVTNYLLDQRQIVARKRDETALELIQQQFVIDLSNQRIAEMQKLLETYPELRRMDTTTVVSVEGGGGNYLSPLAQIVALKATISEANAKMLTIRRQQEEMALRGNFLSSIGVLPAISGNSLTAWLKERKNSLFVSTDAQPQITQKVSHDLDMHLSEPLLYAELWRFKTLPASFGTPILLRRPVPVAVITFLAIWLLLPPIVSTFRVIRSLVSGKTG